MKCAKYELLYVKEHLVNFSYKYWSTYNKFESTYELVYRKVIYTSTSMILTESNNYQGEDNREFINAEEFASI